MRMRNPVGWRWSITYSCRRRKPVLSPGSRVCADWLVECHPIRQMEFHTAVAEPKDSPKPLLDPSVPRRHIYAISTELIGTEVPTAAHDSGDRNVTWKFMTQGKPVTWVTSEAESWVDTNTICTCFSGRNEGVMRGRTGTCQSAITAATSSVLSNSMKKAIWTEREATNQTPASKEIDRPWRILLHIGPPVDAGFCLSWSGIRYCTHLSG
jgi:hypothetical protein